MKDEGQQPQAFLLPPSYFILSRPPLPDYTAPSNFQVTRGRDDGKGAGEEIRRRQEGSGREVGGWGEEHQAGTKASRESGEGRGEDEGSGQKKRQESH